MGKKRKKQRKHTVKEEFLISLIFVGKWLVLGIGALAIIYGSVLFAYNKIYYDPLIKEYDLKISELAKEKAGYESALQLSEKIVSKNKKTINNIYDIEIEKIEKELSETNTRIEKCGETITDKVKFWSKKPKCKKLYDKRSDLTSAKKSLLKKAEELEDVNEMELKKKSELIQEIEGIEIEISSEEKEKEKVGTGAPGMWKWAAIALGFVL